MGKKGSWLSNVKRVLSFEKSQKSKKFGHVTSSPRYLGETKEEIAAVRIQIAFKGYLARKALRSLKAMMRLKSFIEWQSANQQATSTLNSMRTLARIRSRTRAQNQALQKSKHVQRLKPSMGEGFNVSTQSKEQIEAKQQYRQIAAMRREKALAYSYTHQRSWKNPLKPVNQTLMNPNNPQWNWSWLERWMASRPWETQIELDNNDRGKVKNVVTGIPKAYSQGDLNNNDHNKQPLTPTKSTKSPKSTQPPIRRSSSTPPSTVHYISSVSSKITFPSLSPTHDNVTNSHKRHSTGGLTVSDDEMFTSSPRTPRTPRTPSNKMSTTTKGEPRSPSNGTPKKGPARSLEKRLSLPG